jgi:hypothetical protein
VNVFSLLCFCALFVAACERTPEEPAVRAKFGVFFGGQIEERREVPFELDPSKQTQGFRIEFPSPLTTDTDIVWKVDMPASAAPAKTGRAKNAPHPEAHRTSMTGSATIHAGLSRFDQITPFEPGDPLGLWNARVIVHGKVVVDRAFEVYDRAERARAMAPDAGTR